MIRGGAGVRPSAATFKKLGRGTVGKLDQALKLAAQGFHIFPLEPNSKIPHIDGFPRRATRDPQQLRAWWTCPVMEIEQDFNIGISTSHYGDDEALLVVDIDNKGTKHGDDTVLELELQGLELPPTRMQHTPTGGHHMVYRVPTAVKQGVDIFGKGSGLDTRSSGGYIVAAGSEIDGRPYTNDATVMPALAPRWLVEKCGAAPARQADADVPVEGVDPNRARERAIHYLQNNAPQSIKGQAGDQTALKVCMRLKDFGVPQSECLDLLLDHWFEGSGWAPDKLERKVRNAYKYGQERPGAAAAESDFGAPGEPPAGGAQGDGPGHPFAELNKEFAFVLSGGGHHILWETTDADGHPKLERLQEASFHAMHASKMMSMGKKTEPVTKLWMADPQRRSYKGVCFKPAGGVGPEWYNLWRGFAFDHEGDHSPQAQAAVDHFVQHVTENVCGGNAAHARWILGYFAHMIQRPQEKYGVALVLRGRKGVGKTLISDIIGKLLGGHYLLTSNRRYLLGNFNAHMENLLMLTLDEAFWSGDKQAEGQLKDLITGEKQLIEHKHAGSYKTDNFMRVLVLGNEDWVVPASHDERRFAVFEVGSKRQQDHSYFGEMMAGMKAGGYAALLDYLMKFDLSGLDLRTAPDTQALHEQKQASLEPLQQWWFDSLEEGRVLGADFDGPWPEKVGKERLRSAFRRYARDRNIKSRLPDEYSIGRILKKIAPFMTTLREGTGYLYRVPSLVESRKAWEAYIGHKAEWEPS
jgi:hypothetical protein